MLQGKSRVFVRHNAQVRHNLSCIAVFFLPFGLFPFYLRIGTFHSSQIIIIITESVKKYKINGSLLKSEYNVALLIISFMHIKMTKNWNIFKAIYHTKKDTCKRNQLSVYICQINYITLIQTKINKHLSWRNNVNCPDQRWQSWNNFTILPTLTVNLLKI